MINVRNKLRLYERKGYIIRFVMGSDTNCVKYYRYRRTSPDQTVRLNVLEFL